MRYLLVSAAAVMAITGAAAVGNAQMQDKGPGQDKSPGAERAAPPSGGAQRGPEEGEKAQQPSNRSEQKSESRKGAEREPGRDQPRNTQKNEPQRDKSATQPQRDNDKQKSTDQRKGDNDKQKSADQRKDDNDKQRSADQRKGDKDQQKSTDQRQRDKDQQKSTDQRKGDKDQKSTDQRQRDDKDQQKSTKGPDQKRDGRVQVSEEKRSGVRDRLGKDGRRVDRVDRSRINVSITVGARIPRSVRLHTLPVTIVSFAPEYRGYSYIVLEDETICIVDSNTYVIVDVIPAGSQRADRPGRTHLTLSADDMRYIYRTAPKSRTANVRVRLALGAEVPRDVELLAFPDEIVERVPDMRRYRYIVTENDIVIVNPDDHEVALVINE